MPKRRLGVALLVPAPVAAEVDGLRRALGDPARARIPPHVTLVPPVNVRDDRLPDALTVLRRAGAAARPVRLVLGPPATFMPVNPVLHLPVGGSPEAVAALGALRDAVFVEPLARPLTWPFVPHVTLADGAPGHRIEAAMAALADYRVEVTFDRVHLLEETPGRVWAPVADVPLAAPGVVGRGGLELELAVGSVLDPDAGALAGTATEVVVVGRRDGRAVGVARGSVVAGTADNRLTGLAVAPGERRTGVGTQLVAAFAARAAEAGCTRLVADAVAGSDGEAFLRARGWTPAADAVVRLERRL